MIQTTAKARFTIEPTARAKPLDKKVSLGTVLLGAGVVVACLCSYLAGYFSAPRGELLRDQPAEVRAFSEAWQKGE